MFNFFIIYLLFIYLLLLFIIIIIIFLNNKYINFFNMLIISLINNKYIEMNFWAPEILQKKLCLFILKRVIGPFLKFDLDLMSVQLFSLNRKIFFLKLLLIFCVFFFFFFFFLFSFLKNF